MSKSKLLLVYCARRLTFILKPLLSFDVYTIFVPEINIICIDFCEYI